MEGGTERDFEKRGDVACYVGVLCYVDRKKRKKRKKREEKDIHACLVRYLHDIR